MLKPARMKRVILFVLKDDIDRIMQILASFGNFELVEEIDESLGLEAQINEEQSDRVVDLLRRLNYIVNVLEIQETEKPMFSFKEIEDKRIEVIPSNINRILNHTDQELKKIEEKATIAGKLELLHEQHSSLEAELASLEILKKANVDPRILRESRYTSIKIGSIYSDDLEALKKDLEGIKHVLSVTQLNKEESIIGVAFLEDDRQSLDKILPIFGFKEVESSSKSINEIKKELSEINHKIREYENGLNSLKKTHQVNLLAMREIIENCDYMTRKIDKLPKGKVICVLQGWVPRKEVPDLRSKVESITKSHSITESEPTRSDDVPIKLENKSVFRAFEPITKMFGLPTYHEVDPTAIMAFTFPILFGLMFGDLGHGAMVMFGGLVLTRLKGSPSLRDMGVILVFCGISAMFFGVMYGSVFGIEDEILKTIWINPSHDPTVFLVYAIIIGVIQLSFGVIISIFNCILEKHYKHLLVPFGKLAFFWSGVYIIFTLGADFAAWMSSPFAYTAGLGVLLLTTSALVEIEGKVNVKKIIISLLKGLFEVYETAMGFLANTISYARIFALVLVHAGLSLAIFQVATLVGDMLFGIPKVLVLIVGTIGVVGLEGIMVFLHTMRLHYYEWFSKFFSAEGRDFSPLQLKQNHTILKEAK